VRRAGYPLRFWQAQIFEPEKPSFLDDRGDAFGNHDFPAGFAALDFGQHIPGKYIHHRWITSLDRDKTAGFQEVSIKVPEMHFDLEIDRVDPNVDR